MFMPSLSRVLESSPHDFGVVLFLTQAPPIELKMKWNSVFLSPMVHVILAHVMFADKSLGTANSFQAQWVWAASDVPLGGRWPVCWPVGRGSCHATLSHNHRQRWAGDSQEVRGCSAAGPTTAFLSLLRMSPGLVFPVKG